jgi:hypothetical protein
LPPTPQGTPVAATVTVSNNALSNEPLVIDGIAVNNPLEPPFSITADNCTGQTLMPGDTTGCTISLEFLPDAFGPRNEAFDIRSNSTDEPVVTVAVSGFGSGFNLDVTDSIQPDNDRVVAFGNIREGTTSIQTVTVTNGGDLGDLHIFQVASADGLDAPFTISEDTCSNQPLAPAESCTITIVFTPAAITIYQDSFDIPSDDPEETATPAGGAVISVSGGAQPGIRTDSPPSGSALDPTTLLGLGLFGFAVKRIRRRQARA